MKKRRAPLATGGDSPTQTKAELAWWNKSNNMELTLYVVPIDIQN